MKDTEDARSERSDAEQPDFDNYLPGMPPLSTDPGLFERFVTNVFRQRGRFRAVVRRGDQ